MFAALLDWTRSVRQKHPFAAGNVLEIGSLNVNGSVRECFSDAHQYIGIDARPGPGVDEVANAHEIGGMFAAPFNTIVCMEMLEHDPAFWLTLVGIRNCSWTGTIFICTTPTIRFPVHRHPRDYWRFTEDAYRDVIFQGFDLLELDTVKDRHGNPCLCGIGRRV